MIAGPAWSRSWYIWWYVGIYGARPSLPSKAVYEHCEGSLFLVGYLEIETQRHASAAVAVAPVSLSGLLLHVPALCLSYCSHLSGANWPHLPIPHQLAAINENMLLELIFSSFAVLNLILLPPMLGFSLRSCRLPKKRKSKTF